MTQLRRVAFRTNDWPDVGGYIQTQLKVAGVEVARKGSRIVKDHSIAARSVSCSIGWYLLIEFPGLKFEEIGVLPAAVCETF